MRTYPLNLVANVPVPLSVVGNFVRCLTGASRLTVEADNNGQIIELEAMQWWKSDKAFQRVTVLSEVNQFVELKIGDGLFGDDRLAGNVDITGGIKLSGNAAVVAGSLTVGTNATIIRSADANRSRCSVQSIAENSGIVYIGPTAEVTAATGLQLIPGLQASVTWETDIYAIADTAAQNVRFVDEGTNA